MKTQMSCARLSRHARRSSGSRRGVQRRHHYLEAAKFLRRSLIPGVPATPPAPLTTVIVGPAGPAVTSIIGSDHPDTLRARSILAGGDTATHVVAGLPARGVAESAEKSGRRGDHARTYWVTAA